MYNELFLLLSDYESYFFFLVISCFRNKYIYDLIGEREKERENKVVYIYFKN